ncbi:MAG TPA: adenine phosphoribosyltransferase [Thermoanaerobaculia bacterium]|nr:adenine phosphoribosyltransferase [Thermoanaerobaculia bacterium]
MASSDELRAFIREVQDFPKKGIVFKDITPLLRSPRALERSIHELADPYRRSGITEVAGIESRGFIFGSCVARVLGAGFIPIRKPGKLPWTKRRNEYLLEYGSDALEIHDDALTEDDRVLVVDDVLATGGTAAAAAALVRGFGATLVGIATVIELTFLDPRRKLEGVDIHTLIRY